MAARPAETLGNEGVLFTRMGWFLTLNGIVTFSLVGPESGELTESSLEEHISLRWSRGSFGDENEARARKDVTLTRVISRC